MTIVSCQFASWDKIYHFSQMVGGKIINSGDFKIKDFIIVKIEAGTYLSKVVKIEEGEISEEEKKNLRIILRKATEQDLEKVLKRDEFKKEVWNKCEELIKKYNLPMKLIDVLFSFDGGRITYAFISESRVDFRNLVKELSDIFHRSIIFYQVGSRQEAELTGDIGPCGRMLCCLAFLKKLGSISTSFIYDQQLSLRGPERLTGVCGKLKCCLSFEEDVYKELSQNLPAVGSQIETEYGPGKVVSWHILRQSVEVEFEKDRIVEIPIKNPK